MPCGQYFLTLCIVHISMSELSGFADVGRVKDHGSWDIIDKSGNLARATFELDRS